MNDFATRDRLHHHRRGAGAHGPLRWYNKGMTKTAWSKFVRKIERLAKLGLERDERDRRKDEPQKLRAASRP